MDRKSFSSLEIKVHAKIKDSIFAFKDTSLDSKENEQIAEEMVCMFSEYLPKEGDGTGEWECLQKHTKK